MSISSTVFDDGNRSTDTTLNTITGVVHLKEHVEIDECRGLSRSSWEGVLESIGTPYSTVNGQTVLTGNIRKIIKEDKPMYPLKCHYITTCHPEAGLSDNHAREGEILICASLSEGMTDRDLVTALVAECDKSPDYCDMWDAIDHRAGVLEQAIAEEFLGFNTSLHNIDTGVNDSEDLGLYIYAYLSFTPKEHQNWTN
jgi:hypothetical protein